jgi:hypothetical protein
MNIYAGSGYYNAAEEPVGQAFESFGQVISARII